MKRGQLVRVCGFLGRVKGVCSDGRVHVTLRKGRYSGGCTWIFAASEVAQA